MTGLLTTVALFSAVLGGCVFVWAVHFLSCRLTARRCPECDSKWRTELVGEWDGEMWECRACGHCWETPYE